MKKTEIKLIAVLKKLIYLHDDWCAGGRATARFCKSNDEAIAEAKKAILEAENAAPLLWNKDYPTASSIEIKRAEKDHPKELDTESRG